MRSVTAMLHVPTEDEALRYQRQSVFNEMQRTIGMADAVDRMPWLIKEVFRVEAWLDRPTALGTTIASGDLYHFVHDPAPLGLQTDFETVERLIKHDVEALSLWTEATRGKQGNPTGANQHGRGKDNNVHNSSDDPERPVGNSREAALRRLNKVAAGDPKAAEVRKEVLAGKLSPHAAMIQLGLRRETMTIPVDVDLAVATIRRKFSPSQCKQIARLLTEG